MTLISQYGKDITIRLSITLLHDLLCSKKKERLSHMKKTMIITAHHIIQRVLSQYGHTSISLFKYIIFHFVLPAVYLSRAKIKSRLPLPGDVHRGKAGEDQDHFYKNHAA